LFPNTSVAEAQKAYYDRGGKPVAKGGVMHKAKGGGVRLADGGMAPTGAEYHDGNGNFYDVDGYLVE
jgi:hypothetical protein